MWTTSAFLLKSFQETARVFHIINIFRRMSDAKLERATSWEEVLSIHRAWMRDYNGQRHWAHEARYDGCHSPLEVLGGQTGTLYPPAVLDRILFATRYTRHLDKHGFLRFQNWRLYGERGFAQAPVTVWVYDGSLKVEHQAVTLAQYRVELHEDHKQVQKVSSPRLVETPFRSPQLTLFDLGPGEWVLYWRAPDYAPRTRKRRTPGLVQPLLFDLQQFEKVVGGNENSPAPLPQDRFRIVPRPAENDGDPL